MLLFFLAGCDRHRRESPVAPDTSAPPSSAIAVARRDAESSDIIDAGVGIDTPIVPAAAKATLKHFVAEPLTMSAHGIDGTLELWRDSRIDDAFVKRNWFGLTFEYGLPEPFTKIPPSNAIVVVKSVDGRIVESRELSRPIATMETVALGDDGLPYQLVSVDTYSNGGSWDGTSHVFVRIEHGRARWLDCLVLRKGMRIGFSFEPRPSGGNDVLTHYISTDGWTDLARIEVVDGTCRKSQRRVSGMRCETSACPAASEYPPRD